MDQGRQLPWQSCGHQHGVDETVWMPREKQHTRFIGNVFIVNDVDLPKPNAGDEPEQPSEQSVKQRGVWLG